MKIDSETKTRKDIFKTALYYYGPEGLRAVQMHFNKYDKILQSCKNDTERSHIKHLAIIELHQMMRYTEGLAINHKPILPPLKSDKK